MSIHATSRVCHHPDVLVQVSLGVWEVGSHIIGIIKSFVIDSDNHDAYEEIISDTRLLKRVFTTPISTVKSIHIKCFLDFSQELED